MPLCRAEIRYAGEKVFAGTADLSGQVIVNGLLEGKQYMLFVLGAKKKDTHLFSIRGSEENTVRLE